ncbi:MAG: CpcT/CpeT family chromophore lyase [Planctomycetota bacterium]
MNRLAFPTLLGLVLFLSLPACETAEPAPVRPEYDDELVRLASWMEGRFATETTSDDAAIHRLDVTRIWPDRADGIWLVVERSWAGASGRTDLWRVARDAETERLVVTLHAPPGDAGRFRGAAEAPERLDEFGGEEPMARTGGTLRIEGLGPRTYFGETEGRDCAPTAPGASYATISTVVTPVEFRLWERDFDAGGRRVGGPEEGPRVYRRP